MSRFESMQFTRWSRATYLTIALGLGLVLLMGGIGTWQDVVRTREMVLQREANILAAQAERRVSHLEKYLNQHATGELDWLQLKHQDNEVSQWVANFWKGVKPLQEHELFAAITDQANIVVMHSQPDLVDGQLSHSWYDRRREVGEVDMFELTGSVLSDGRHAFDIRIPIVVGGEEVGAYHEGLDADWVLAEMDRAGWDAFGNWAIVIVGMVAAMIVAAVAMLYIGRRKAALIAQMRATQLEQVVQIENLAAGLAHEIRNPLHAIRLNLHAFGRAWQGQTQLTGQDVAMMIRESNTEIDRVERLMQELMGFARPEAAKNETFSAGKLAKATVNFLREEMRRKDIQVETNVSSQPLYVWMDPARFRQVLINLLSNAREAVGEKGKISLSLERRLGRAEIVIADDGPGIDEDECERIFDPFYSTKNNGSGLGLALVRKFVEEVGGKIVCEANHPRGARFRLQLPLAPIPRSRLSQLEIES